MKRISVAALVLAGAGLSLGFTNVKPWVVYGEDNRKDIYQVTDQGLLEVAQATMAMVDVNRLKPRGQDFFDLDVGKFHVDFNLCHEEAFHDQPTIANCSGFLVGEDLVATAGHCMTDYECADYRFVFGFAEAASGVIPTKIESENVYSCQKILAREMTDRQDYALIKLDRPVRGRKPLRMALQPVQEGDELAVIGHPSGLPTKIADGARVRNQTTSHFVANTDTYGGNSGSAVINSRTLEVLGILVRGENDFIFDSSRGCNRSYKCASDDCRGEDATHISYIIKAMPQ